MVTKEAITTMNAGIRTLDGMKLRRSEMTRLEQTSTNAVASPMPRPLSTLVVTASVGHMPSTSRKVGFSVMMPLKNIFLRSCLATMNASPL